MAKRLTSKTVALPLKGARIGARPVGVFHRCHGSLHRSRPSARFARWPPRGRAIRRDARSCLRPAAGHTSSSPRPAFAVWPFQRTLPAAVGEVGKRGAWPSVSIIFTWRSFRAPPAFFCLLADLTAFALRLPTSGLGFMVSAQTAHRHAANPAPSSLHAHPVHDPCSREGDAGIMREMETAWRKRPEISTEIERNQGVGRNVFSRGISLLPSREKVPERSEGGQGVLAGAQQ